jgi:hypothetical protein
VRQAYRAETFHTPQGDVEFWVPHGQTPLESITMLLDGFEREENMRGDLMAARCYVASYAANKMNHSQAVENAITLYDKIGKSLGKFKNNTKEL